MRDLVCGLWHILTVLNYKYLNEYKILFRGFTVEYRLKIIHWHRLAVTTPIIQSSQLLMLVKTA